ncbi:MAG: hypothetical protein RJB60_903 [Pseudomonadota bacterium]|jgi:O-antigen/teichoic acid export membrane protein
MSVKQRITYALAASTFGQGITIGTQLLLIPMFFHYWGAGLYGEWLILSSVPAYLTMADLGIGSAAGNEMTMMAGAGNLERAQQTYRGAHWVALGAGLIALLIGLLLACMATFWMIPKTTLISPSEAGWIIVLFSLGVSINFQGSVISAGYRAAGRNGLGIGLNNTSRLLEAVGMGILLAKGAGPMMVCTVALCVKAVMLLLQHFWLQRTCPWLHHPPMPADRTLVKRLIAPALGFMAFPLGNALALQGPILVIGHLMGGPAVALFSATRTLARVPIQIANVFNSSVWPEMSRAHGSGNIPLLRTLHRSSWGITFVLVATSSVALLVLGPWLAKVWLGEATKFDTTILIFLISMTLFSATWSSSSVVLTAINAHGGLGLRYVLVNAICLGLTWVLTPSFGWWGMLAPLVLAEVLLLAWILPKVMTITQDNFGSFARQTIAEGAINLIDVVKRRKT